MRYDLDRKGGGGRNGGREGGRGGGREGGGGRHVHSVAGGCHSEGEAWHTLPT